MRAYLRLDPDLVDKKIDYPDGAFRAFVESLCFAEQQQPRGRFRSRKLLAVLLGRRSRWIPYLIAHGDLIETATGKLYVEGWDEWQEGDVTVSERMRRLRSRQRGVTPTDTPAVTVETVSVPLGGGGGGKPEAVSRGGDGSPSREPTFMGFRPRASADEVRRLEAESWTKCSEPGCELLGRQHGETRPGHAFRPKAAKV